MSNSWAGWGAASWGNRHVYRLHRVLETVLLGLHLFSGAEGMLLALPGPTGRCPDGTGGTLPYKSCYLLSQHLKGPVNGGWLPCTCTCRPCCLCPSCRSLPQ